MGVMKPTDEQEDAVFVFNKEEDLVLEAGAGCGKTSSLKMISSSTKRQGVYMAYNKSIATEAASSFPRNIECRTAHSFAYRAVGHRYRDRLNAPLQPWWQVAKALGINESVQIGDRNFTAVSQARLALEMVGNFCNSNSLQVLSRHRPFVDGLRGTDGVDHHDALGDHLLPLARDAWDQLQDPNSSSPVRFTHDCYLKLWSLSNPVISADFILLDEAQDCNPALAGVIAQQQCQIVAVGDSSQAIYGWRGATDYMSNGMPDAEHRYLSLSFRFGDPIAEVANSWLDQLDTVLRLRGNPAVESTVGVIERPSAVLCRTNVGALEALIAAQNRGQHAFLVGGSTEIIKFLDAVVQLQQTGKTFHRDLVAFGSWGEVLEYVKESKGMAGDLGTWVRLLEKYGIETVRAAVSGMSRERDADVTISTGHKSKGLQWEAVAIHSDFAPRQDENGGVVPLSDSEIMLRYVAVTRAQYALDLGVLAGHEGEAS